MLFNVKFKDITSSELIIFDKEYCPKGQFIAGLLPNLCWEYLTLDLRVIIYYKAVTY